MRRDLRAAHALGRDPRLAQQALGEHPRARPRGAQRDRAGREVVHARDPARVAGGEDDALLAAPEVHEDRIAPGEHARRRTGRCSGRRDAAGAASRRRRGPATARPGRRGCRARRCAPRRLRCGRAAGRRCPPVAGGPRRGARARAIVAPSRVTRAARRGAPSITPSPRELGVGAADGRRRGAQLGRRAPGRSAASRPARARPSATRSSTRSAMSRYSGMSAIVRCPL